MTPRMRTAGLVLVVLAGLMSPHSAAAAPAYRMSLDVDYAEGTFQGDVTVLCENRTPVAFDELFFRLYGNADVLYGAASIEVTSTLVAGDPAATTLFADDTVLFVPLARPLAPGESIEVRLAFHGRAARTSEAGFATETEYGLLTKSPDVLTLTAFYPILAPYAQEGWVLDPVNPVGDPLFADAATYDVSLVVDANVSTIPRADTTSREPDGRVRLSFARAEMRDFPLALVSGERTPLETSSDGIVIRSWFAPRHAEASSVALERGAAAVGIYSALFGPLPYASVDIVEAPLQRAAGVEFSGLFLVSEANAANPQDAFFDVIVSHEMAHQWFYAAVGNDPTEEPWLDEALATYASNVFLSVAVSAAAAQGERAVWAAVYDRARQVRPDLHVTSPVYAFPDSGTYAAFVYSGGALELDALRREIGDDASHTAGIAIGADLAASFRRACECWPTSMLFGADAASGP
jgi:hypothetical protein